MNYQKKQTKIIKGLFFVLLTSNTMACPKDYHCTYNQKDAGCICVDAFGNSLVNSGTDNVACPCSEISNNTKKSPDK